MSYDYSSDYVRHFPKPDLVFEDELIDRIKGLEGEVETLRATLVMVREVLVSTAPRGELILSRIIDALGEIR